MNVTSRIHRPAPARRVLEAGEGVIALFLHAFPLSADMWRQQLEHVPAGWRFVGPDLRGLGERPAGVDAAAPATSLDDHAADALALMDGLGPDPAVIVGLSMGGYIAQALVRRAPHRVRALVLCNTKPEADSPEARDNRVRMRASLAEGGPAAVADAMIPKLLGATSRRDRPALVARVRELIERNDPSGIDAAIVALMGRPDVTDALATIACPTLVIAGDEDEVIPVDVQARMHAAIPNARLETIAGAGHLANMERPDAFDAALHAFLAALAPRP